MAIAFDNATSGNATATSLTISHNNLAGNLAVIAVGVPTADTITGVTYNGVSAIQINKISNPTEGRFCYLYYLLAPATGTNNCVISSSGGAQALWATIGTYTGVKQTTPNASNTNTATANSIATSVTTTVNNCWTFITCRVNNDTIPTATGGTARGTNDSRGTLWDSNGALSSGSNSITLAEGSSFSWGTAMTSFAPNTSNFLTFF